MDSVEKFISYTIPVKNIINKTDVDRFICEIIRNRCSLKRNIFKTELYISIYNNIILNSDTTHEYKDYISTFHIFDSYSLIISIDTKKLLTDILSSMFSASFAVCHCYSNNRQLEKRFVLLPWLWHHFLVCDPSLSYSLVADKYDIVDFILNNYMGLTLEIIHYS